MKEKKEKSIIRLSQSCVHSKIIARKKERQAGWCLRSEGPSFSSRSRGALESEESMRAVPPIGNKFSGCKGTIEGGAAEENSSHCKSWTIVLSGLLEEVGNQLSVTDHKRTDCVAFSGP